MTIYLSSSVRNNSTEEWRIRYVPKSGAPSQEVLGVGRTADGAQGFLVPALKTRLQVWRKVSQGQMKIGASFRFRFSPMSGCQRRTALMAPAIGGVKLVVCGGGSVHRLAHATGMRGRRGDRQSDGGYRAHEQQDKQ
jgi:hypothetical protein